MMIVREIIFSIFNLSDSLAIISDKNQMMNKNMIKIFSDYQISYIKIIRPKNSINTQKISFSHTTVRNWPQNQ